MYFGLVKFNVHYFRSSLGENLIIGEEFSSVTFSILACLIDPNSLMIVCAKQVARRWPVNLFSVAARVQANIRAYYSHWREFLCNFTGYMLSEPSLFPWRTETSLRWTVFSVRCTYSILICFLWNQVNKHFFDHSTERPPHHVKLSCDVRNLISCWKS